MEVRVLNTMVVWGYGGRHVCASDPKHPWDDPFYPWSSFLLGARPWPSKRTTQGMAYDCE